MTDRTAKRTLLTLATLVALPAAAAAQAHEHSHDDPHGHAGLHFAHPMISGSVSPDRKVRLDYVRLDFPEASAENAFQITGEWAPTRAVSLEAAVPYSATASALGFTEVAVKFSSYAFEDRGLLLGGGLAAGLPTSGDAPEETHGDHHHGEGDHGHGSRRVRGLDAAPGLASGGGPPAADGISAVRPSLGRDHYEIEPFLNAGWKAGPWEVVAFTRFGIPTADGAESGSHPHLTYNASVLYRATSRVQALLEYDGVSEVGEPGPGHREGYLSPGLKVRIFEGRTLFLGGAVSLPVAGEESLDNRVRISLFQHF